MVILNDILYLSVKNLSPWFSQSFLDKQTSLGLYPYIYAHDPEQCNRKEIKLVGYDSIPEATRIAKNIPAKEIFIKQYAEQRLVNYCSLDHEAYGYFLKSPLIKHSKEATREHQAKSKAEQFGFLKAIAAIKTTEVRLQGNADKNEFYSKCLTALNTLARDRQWYKWKCTTVVGLRKRLKYFTLTPALSNEEAQCRLIKAYDSLISKKANNKNRELLEEDQKAFLVQQYADANAKISVEQLWTIYMRKAETLIAAEIWPAYVRVTANTLRNYLLAPANIQLWFEARNGYQEYRNKFEAITNRQRATFANALWVIDGTPMHRYFQHGKYGKFFRWNIFIVMDAHSQCVLGFWISEKENTDSVLGALRAACYVSGCLPHQTLYDHGAAIQSYRAQEAIQKISVVAFAATAGNARSKPVEGYFHWLNEHVNKFRKGFTHNPFAKKLDNRPNREALALMVKNEELSLATEALQEIIEDFTIANNTPRPFLGNISALKAYQKSIEASRARQREFTETIDIEAFWTQPGEQKKIKTIIEGKPSVVNTFIATEYPFTNRGIDITINNKPFSYDIEDAAFRAISIGKKFTVRYEPNPDKWANGCPEKLLLYVQGAPVQWKGMHLAALPKELMPMAVADYQPGTRAELNRRLANKKEQRAMVQSDLTELINHTRVNGTYQDVITDNAFDKEVLSATQEQLMNRMLGVDHNSDGPVDDDDEDYTKGAPTVKKADRFAGYDERETL